MFSLYRAHTVPLGVIFPQFYTMGTYHFSIRTTCLPSTLISLIEGVFTERQLCRRPSAGPWETASHSRPVPPAPSMEVTDFQGSGRVPYLLRGADSEEDIPAGERSASPQHGGCFLRGRGFQVGLEGCMAPAPLCTECHCSHHRGQLPADSRPRAVPLSPPQRGVGWHLAETHSMPASCAGCLSTHRGGESDSCLALFPVWPDTLDWTIGAGAVWSAAAGLC